VTSNESFVSQVIYHRSVIELNIFFIDGEHAVVYVATCASESSHCASFY